MRAPISSSVATALLLTLCVPVSLAVSGAPGVHAAEIDARELTAEEVVSRWRGRLRNRHFIADVSLEMEVAGSRETRELRVLRDDGPEAGERVLVRFAAPTSLRNLGLLYLEKPDGPNDYYLYQPDKRRVRRLPESIADEDVYGIDLEFLGFGGTPSAPVDVVSATRERLGEHEVYRIHERARVPNPRFEERVLWIDTRSFLARRTEHRFDGVPYLIAETQLTEESSGVVMPRRVRFRSGRDLAQTVQLEVKRMDLSSPIPEELFTVVALTRRRVPGPER